MYTFTYKLSTEVESTELKESDKGKIFISWKNLTNTSVRFQPDVPSHSAPAQRLQVSTSAEISMKTRWNFDENSLKFDRFTDTFSGEDDLGISIELLNIFHHCSVNHKQFKSFRVNHFSECSLDFLHVQPHLQLFTKKINFPDKKLNFPRKIRRRRTSNSCLLQNFKIPKWPQNSTAKPKIHSLFFPIVSQTG